MNAMKVKMNLKITGVIVAGLIALGAMQGCAISPLTGTTYSVGQVRSVQTVQHGTVVGVTLGQITPSQNHDFFNPSPARQASVIGGLLGAAAGSSLGGGRGNLLLTIGGAVAGAVAGNHVGKHMSTRAGETLTIKLKSGKTIAVTQQVEGEPLSAGTAVEVLTGSDGTVRVIPDNTIRLGQALR